MGGVGSGRPPAADRKVCLEDCVSVTAQQLQQSYRWAPEPGADQAAVTWLSLGEDWTFQEREAQLRRVQGRWLVVCPQCDRTVAALYLPRGKKDYQCRHCYDLTYRSRQTWDARVAALEKDPEALVRALSELGTRGVTPAARAAMRLIHRRQDREDEARMRATAQATVAQVFSEALDRAFTKQQEPEQ